MEIGYVKKQSITDELKRSYLDYAMSVIVARALPDVRDGLKPVHRRILYAMHGMGLNSSAKFRKSATIVGECFVKDTMVLTEKGLIPIQEINFGDKVYTQKGLCRVTQLYEMPKKELLEVVLENGLSNTVTPSQKFKVINKDWKFEWKEAKNLKPEDYLVIKASYPKIKKRVQLKKIEKDHPSDLSYDLAYLLGVFVSDGWITEDYSKKKLSRLGFCGSKETMLKVADILRKEFNYNPTIEKKPSVYQIRINDLKINSFFLINFSIKGSRTISKKIPFQIFRSPKDVIFSFISGLIEGDGSISKNRNQICYGSISERLVNQLMVLLQHQGIFSSKMRALNKNNFSLNIKANFKHFYNLEVRGKDAVMLSKNLVLADSRKAGRLKSIEQEDWNKRKSWSSFDNLPYGANFIFSELSQSHLGGGWHLDGSGNKFRMGIKYLSGCKIRYSSNLKEKSLGREQVFDWGIEKKLKKIGSGIYPFLKKIKRNEVYFLKVSSIKKAAAKKTYDIQVEKDHEFIANGVVSHNCLGKYHPHGDMAVYETMVKMAQVFNFRYPLVNGQGNFGSMDGDNAAAPRYTEAKMAKIAEDMLADIDKETVDWVDNYDGTRKEPVVLPAKVPQLLLNGVMGIAVGMATNIPPHNLGELVDALIYLVDQPEASVKDLFKFVKGPDFPTGGEIYNKKGMIHAYSIGEGPIVTRAKIEILEQKAGKFQIIVHEMTYNVNKANLITKIADLVKQKKLEGIRDVRDESDKEGVRIAIDLKSEVQPKKILNRLYKLTDLQKTFHLNMLALVDGIQPQILSLKTILEKYLEHRKDVVVRRAKFELKKARERAHILEGLVKALDHIDEVIETIKKSKNKEEAHKNLVKKFKLTDLQASAILEIRLQTLASLEQKKIKDELEEKRKIIAKLEALLKSNKKIMNLIKEELAEMKEKYGDKRKTKVYSQPVGELSEEATIAEEECMIIMTQGGYIKRFSPKTYKAQKRGGKGMVAIVPREEDKVGYFLSSSTYDNLLFFTDRGRVFQTKAYEVPEASRTARGKAIVNLLQLDSKEEVTAILNVSRNPQAKYLVMATQGGIIKRTAIADFGAVRRNGLIAMNMHGKDRLKWAKLSNGEDDVLMITAKGQSIRFKEKDVRVMGRTASGVKGVALKKEDKTVKMDIIDAEAKEAKLLIVTANGFGKKTEIKQYKVQKRGGSGIKTASINEKTGDIVAAQVIQGDEGDVIAISQKGNALRSNLKDIPTQGRVTQGVRIMKLSNNNRVVSMACV